MVIAASSKAKKPKHRRDFGDRVRSLRHERGFTLEGLAERTGLSANYLGEVERATRNVSLDNIVKIARGLRVRPEDLFRA